jgi:hypothetical protein
MELTTPNPVITTLLGLSLPVWGAAVLANGARVVEWVDSAVLGRGCW